MHLGATNVIKIGRMRSRTLAKRACPPGYSVFQSAPANRRVPSLKYPEWSCSLIEAPPAPAVAPQVTVSPTFEVSPAIQTQVSPQISPVFSQLQDSPYARTSAAPRQDAGGAQVAKGPDPAVQQAQLAIQQMREQAEFEKQHQAEARRIQLEDRTYAEQQGILQRERDEAARLKQMTDQYSTTFQDAYQVAAPPAASPSPITVPSSPTTAPSFGGSGAIPTIQEMFPEAMAPIDPVTPISAPRAPITQAGMGMDMGKMLPILAIGGAALYFLTTQKGG